MMMVLEISLTWEPQHIGWNITNVSEQFLANSKDPRRVKSSNITVKVKDKILHISFTLHTKRIIISRISRILFVNSAFTRVTNYSNLILCSNSLEVSNYKMKAYYVIPYQVLHFSIIKLKVMKLSVSNHIRK